MKHFTCKIILSVFCSVLILFCLPVTAWADKAGENPDAGKTEFNDCTGDQAKYGARVAELNRQGEGRSGKKGEAKDLFAVLCRTEGQKVDFSAWGPAYVVAGPKNRFTLYFSGEKEAALACSELAATAGILYAELDTEVTASGTETIGFQSWGATRMNYGAYLNYASPWCSGAVTVAVIDSGVYPHALLASRMTESGYDYVDADNDSTNDPYGHGTNVAGILADCTPDVAVAIYPIRVLNSTGGGNASNVANAVLEAVEKGVEIINLSLEGNSTSLTLDDAVREAVGEGITVVVAAGNKAKDTSTVSPARLTDAGVLVVASAETDGTRSSYSNFGTSVDVYAYGTAIRCCSNSGGYQTATGTSMAAPHMSALAAMLKLLHPALTPSEIEFRVARAAPETEINVPDLSVIIPEKLGFSLHSIRLEMQDTLQLPVRALPETAEEEIAYQSSDETVITVQNGALVPLSQGMATVTASCTGFETCSFTVTTEAVDGGSLLLPSQLLRIENEAFFGNNSFSRVSVPNGVETIGDQVFDSCVGLKQITLPDSVTAIGENSFSNAVLFCPEGSAAEEYAVENGMNYVLLTE